MCLIIPSVSFRNHNSKLVINGITWYLDDSILQQHLFKRTLCANLRGWQQQKKLWSHQVFFGQRKWHIQIVPAEMCEDHKDQTKTGVRIQSSKICFVFCMFYYYLHCRLICWLVPIEWIGPLCLYETSLRRTKTPLSN